MDPINTLPMDPINNLPIVPIITLIHVGLIPVVLFSPSHSILLLYELCICCSCIQECHPKSLLGTTLCAAFCACLLGSIMVFGALVWLCLWISGTYFLVMAATEMRMEMAEVEHKKAVKRKIV